MTTYASPAMEDAQIALGVAPIYIIARIPQVDGSVRYVGVAGLSRAREARQAIRDNPPMIDHIRPVVTRDRRTGLAPEGWLTLSA